MVEQLGLGELKDKMKDGRYVSNSNTEKFHVIGGKNNYLYTGKGEEVLYSENDEYKMTSDYFDEDAYFINKGDDCVWLLKSAITPEQFAKLCAELNIQ